MIYRTLQVTLQDVRDMQTICRLHMAMDVEKVVAEGIAHQLPAHDVAYAVLEHSTELTDILESLTFCEGLLINGGKESGTLALSNERFMKLTGKLLRPIGENIMKRATGYEMNTRFKELEINRQRMMAAFDEPGYIESSASAQVAQMTPKDPSLN